MRLFVILLSITGFAALSRADDAAVSYFRDVRPIFVGNCNSCHKPEKLKGDLDTTSVAMILKGGKHHPDLVPGNPDKSKLIEMISGDDPDMPQDGDPLKPAQIAMITRWIEQ